jgi:hypothetical protein
LVHIKVLVLVLLVFEQSSSQFASKVRLWLSSMAKNSNLLCDDVGVI